MRRVVAIELPKKVTLEWLIKEKACIEGIEWFVQNFSIEAPLSKVLVKAMVNKKVYNQCDYEQWLVSRKDTMPNDEKAKLEETLSKNITPLNEVNWSYVYLMKFDDGKIYKLHKFKGLWYWMGFSNSSSGCKKGYETIQEAMACHINKKDVKIYEIRGAIEIKERSGLVVHNTLSGRFKG